MFEPFVNQNMIGGFHCQILIMLVDNLMFKVFRSAPNRQDNGRAHFAVSTNTTLTG